MSYHPVIFAGAGPGDPELITVKGQKALMAADLVVYAGSLVPRALLVWAEHAEAVNSAPLHLDDIVGIMADAVRQGKKVVRLHTGDPSLYGAICEQMDALKAQGIPFAVIPGVTAAFAAAAAMQLEYTLPEVTQTLILTRMAGRTPVPESENLRSLAAHKAAMAIYLSIGQIDEVQEIICECYGPQFVCGIGVKVSQPEEQLIYVPACDLARTIRSGAIKQQTLIVVSPGLNRTKSLTAHKSRLYAKDFTHDYRS